MEADGGLHVLEFKRAGTPRDVVAQVLDSGSWVPKSGYMSVVSVEPHPSRKRY